MGMQDRDYARERKLDYGADGSLKKTIDALQKGLDQQTEKNAQIPTWAFATCGIGALVLILWIGMHH